MVELEPRTLLSGLVVGESRRWHDGRLWFANWGAAGGAGATRRLALEPRRLRSAHGSRERN